MHTEHPIWQSKTAEVAAKKLSPGCTIRYEPPEVAGRGYAALVLDSVARTADDRIEVEWSDGRLEVVMSSVNPDLPPLLEDPFDLVEWPDSLSFNPEEAVTVEIRPPAYA